MVLAPLSSIATAARRLSTGAQSWSSMDTGHRLRARGVVAEVVEPEIREPEVIA